MPEITPRGDVDPCPLCAARSALTVCEVPYAEIWAWLETVWGATISDEVRATNAPEPTTTLVACAECGLEYFHPLHPGDGRFYAEVMRAVPYEGSRWEFDVVARRLRPEDRVVDFGCGEGAFLRHIRDRVAQAVGIDHNPEAALKAATAGISISTEPFPDFGDAHRDHFDVACGFQVVEHVPAVEDLLDPMLTCLGPGGRLFLSLPNRERYPAVAVDALDHPPHHLSRWAPAQLRELAERRGLELTSVEFEEPDFSTATLATRNRWAHRITAGRRPPGGLARVVAKLISKVTLTEGRHRRLADRAWFTDQAVFGHTMLAEFRVP